MNSRETILALVKKNQPSGAQLPDIDGFRQEEPGLQEKYISILEGIGGKAFVVKDYNEVLHIIQKYFPEAKRVVTTCSELTGISGVNPSEDPHAMENIDLAILRAHLGVAENASVWLTEDAMKVRVLPFICQYLAVVLDSKDIVATMHYAYEKIGSADYGFGTFIAGPSKTADIEQSLVLGAHGPKGMTVFIMNG